MRTEIELSAEIERWPLRRAFKITGYAFTESEVLVVELRDGELRGRGECAGVYYNDDTPERARAQVLAAAGAIRAGITREELLGVLPPGGARNAVDCALWDLEAKQQRRPAWQIAGLQPPRPVMTTMTIGADEPATMAEHAREYARARAIKLKLTGDELDAERVRAVRTARPDVWLGVDANQGFTRESLSALLPALVEARVELVEQPFPRDRDELMDGLRSPIPVAADESAQDIGDLDRLAGRFDVINIKLDKCGGLTRGLAMAAAARERGMRVMVGCMNGTSLAMAPGTLLGQLCDVVDLDGPLILSSDREPPVSYDDGYVSAPEALWGGAA
ncbi:MAG TPA: N-acetyl-D-Glu racemase DgcA [Candidatus Elarobacter sp.]|nr:N-acetyl-D-Glu racemase DgcA [Candidatus Elarobacter sp.]